VVSNLYGTEIEIWAGFGPVGSNEKKNWADYEQLLRPVFPVFRDCSVRTKKLHNIFFIKIGSK
jgi:hypothetical protein